MSIGGALELIQSFNNPKIIDAPDSSLQEGELHSRWKLLSVHIDFIQFNRKWCKQAPWLIAKRNSLTLYLLLFAQSM